VKEAACCEEQQRLALGSVVVVAANPSLSEDLVYNIILDRLSNSRVPRVVAVVHESSSIDVRTDESPIGLILGRMLFASAAAKIPGVHPLRLVNATEIPGHLIRMEGF